MTLRKVLWGERSRQQGGLGQDGKGVQLRSSRLDSQDSQGGGPGESQQSIPSRTGGEAFRDLDQGNRLAVKLTLLDPFEAVYTEPMFLQLAQQPAGGILCIHIEDALQPEVPASCGTAVHYRWDGKQAVITSIDGLTTGTRKYRFTFLVVG